MHALRCFAKICSLSKKARVQCTNPVQGYEASFPQLIACWTNGSKHHGGPRLYSTHLDPGPARHYALAPGTDAQRSAAIDIYVYASVSIVCFRPFTQTRQRQPWTDSSTSLRTRFSSSVSLLDLSGLRPRPRPGLRADLWGHLATRRSGKLGRH